MLVHDAARPLLTPELVDALPAPRSTTTRLRRRDRRGAGDRHGQARRRDGARVTETLDRTRAVGGADAAGVPPRRARAGARRGADDVLAAATDDASLVERDGGRVRVVEAPAENLKVTTPCDLRFAELLLRAAADGATEAGGGPGDPA